MRASVWVVRALFVVLAVVLAVYISRGWHPAPDTQLLRSVYDYLAILIGMGASVPLVVLDILFQKKSLAVVLAVCLGLIAGTLLELLVRHVVRLTELTDLVAPSVELGILLFLCYVATTIILQTREDFHIVVPYVRFQPQNTEPTPFVLDTSVIIDGRIADIAETGVIDNPLVVPRFVLNELQGIADSADRLKRNRGRRGLDVLGRLQKSSHVSVQIRDFLTDAHESVDTKLVTTAKGIKGRVVTNDFNLNKIAQLQGVGVININDLAQALRPVMLPGEEMEVKIIRPGEEPGQGVGFLDDGTMVVVEQGREFIGQKTVVVVNNVYQTSAGRMIFAKPQAQSPGTSQQPRQPGPDRQ
jgi:uncharacterized protein YacL